MNIQNYFAPKETDILYTHDLPFIISLILMMDSYKFSHPFAYKPGIVGMVSYGCARISPSEEIVPAGMQMFLKEELTKRITMEDVDIAEEFSIKHFGRKLFARDSFEEVVNSYDGYLPLIIRSVPEGTVIRGGQPIYTVSAFGKKLFWMASAYETIVQRAIWYPTTIATDDYITKKEITEIYKKTCDDLSLIPFSLHDFGARGTTCSQQAQIGGAAHLFNFMGSDTIEGVLAANFFYKADMAGFSVYATEHSVECSFGKTRENAIDYLTHQIKQAPRGSIVSVVIDGYDVYREAEILCTVLKDVIIASGVKVVFRPDSGDMMEVVPRILHMQAATFGYEINSKGFKVIKHVGVIQGDGVDRLSLLSLLDFIAALGYAASNVIFGSGGALLQKINRDTKKVAQKACAFLFEKEDGTTEWVGAAKDPITDHGKKSLEGVLTLVRSRMTGELMTARLDQGPLDSEWEEIHKLVYHCGKLYNETTLDEIRARLEF